MSMKNSTVFAVNCTDPQRHRFPAKYKIAAEWIGGGFSELKTFGFADDECIEPMYRSAVLRAAAIRFSEGERLGDVHIYLLNPKIHDCDLPRALELEERLRQNVGREELVHTG